MGRKGTLGIRVNHIVIVFPIAVAIKVGYIGSLVDLVDPIGNQRTKCPSSLRQLASLSSLGAIHLQSD